jgi:hypothetical protein
LTFSLHSDTLINREKNKKIKEGKEDCVGSLKEKRFFGKQGQLFISSPVAVSENLYTLIIEALEEKVGDAVKRITRKRIEKVLEDPIFYKEVYLTTTRRYLVFPVILLEIVCHRPYEEGFATVKLELPLTPTNGNCGLLEKAVKRIACEVGLEDFPCFQNGIEAGVALSGESLPYRIIPNPFSLIMGKDRGVFVTSKEILTGRYSPIA